jgi:hypothetical protein
MRVPVDYMNLSSFPVSLSIHMYCTRTRMYVPVAYVLLSVHTCRLHITCIEYRSGDVCLDWILFVYRDVSLIGREWGVARLPLLQSIPHSQICALIKKFIICHKGNDFLIIKEPFITRINNKESNIFMLINKKENRASNSRIFLQCAILLV